MTVMHRFCFWYSVRLGTIIVALTCMAQCLPALIACSMGTSDLEKTSSTITLWLQTNNMKITKLFFEAIRDDPKTFLTGFTIYFSAYLCSCVSLIYGAFKCKVLYMYPFMILDFIRLVALSFTMVMILIVVKENTLDLGVIISCSISGVFILLYLWYQWFCVVTLCQILKERETRDNHSRDTRGGAVAAKREYESKNEPLFLKKVRF